VNEAAKISGYSASRNRRLSASEYFCCFLTPFCHQLLGGNHNTWDIAIISNKMLVSVGDLPVVVALDYSSIRLQLN
jgi:hypothetical protein